MDENGPVAGTCFLPHPILSRHPREQVAETDGGHWQTANMMPAFRGLVRSQVEGRRPRGSLELCRSASSNLEASRLATSTNGALPRDATRSGPQVVVAGSSPLPLDSRDRWWVFVGAGIPKQRPRLFPVCPSILAALGNLHYELIFPEGRCTDSQRGAGLRGGQRIHAASASSASSTRSCHGFGNRGQAPRPLVVFLLPTLCFTQCRVADQHHPQRLERSERPTVGDNASRPKQRSAIGRRIQQRFICSVHPSRASRLKRGLQCCSAVAWGEAVQAIRQFLDASIPSPPAARSTRAEASRTTARHQLRSGCQLPIQPNPTS